ncbi:MAG: hypothetical protein KDA80_12105 [Planctomycetaceae bacterium]|nr:hypothetical protein [Planctomycetaceae bacterium]
MPDLTREPSATESQKPPRNWEPLLWGAIALLLAVEIPLTLRRPLTPDCILFDLEWRTWCRGGLPYRDIFETNPPGTMWVHGLVRTWMGTSSEALRALDLAVMLAAIAGLAIWVKRLGQSRIVALLAAFLLIWFYGMQSIWCQCQRDGWMLAISLAAMELRWRRLQQLSGPSLGWSGWLSAVLEGCLWGCAVWIKPFVMVPGIFAWGASLKLLPDRKLALADWSGLMLGGLLIGGMGSAWMIQSGLWEHFWEVNLEWNGDYLASRRLTWRILLALAVHFGPWFLLYLLTPACLLLWGMDRSRGVPSVEAARLLWGAFTCGWFVQGLLLQHTHAYVHVPLVMVAVVVVAATPTVIQARLWPVAFGLGVLGILAMHPLARFEHLGSWWQCVAGPVTPELRMEVRGPLDRIYPGGPDLLELQDVGEFLQAQGVSDGQVTCYSFWTMPLYRDLDLKPPCRFICPRIYANRFFVGRRAEIAQLLRDSPQKYVVTDLVLDGFTEEEANAVGPRGPNAPPPLFAGKDMPGIYPWSHPVVFRSGRYLVHEIQGELGEFSSQSPKQVRESTPNSH